LSPVRRGRLSILIAFGFAVAMTAVSSTAPAPAEAATYLTFGSGVHRVGRDIKPGTYRTRVATTNCYWARLSGFSGELRHIKANEFGSGYMVVKIKSTDVGFESSGCGKWSSNLSRVTSSMTQFGQGTFIVNTDMKPGTYRSSKGDGCYWARLSGFTGTLSKIIANDFRSSGTALVTIRSTDKGFQSSGCGTWTRQ
jgi:hypothetical protein